MWLSLQDISDCELAPVGNVLAAASLDGFVKFWQISLDDEEEEVATPQYFAIRILALVLIADSIIQDFYELFV